MRQFLTKVGDTAVWNIEDEQGFVVVVEERAKEGRGKFWGGCMTNHDMSGLLWNLNMLQVSVYGSEGEVGAIVERAKGFTGRRLESIAALLNVVSVCVT